MRKHANRITVPATLVAAAAAASSWGADGARVSVLSDDGDRVVVEVAIAGEVSETVAIDGIAHTVLRLPGEAVSLERGAPDLPCVARSVIVADEGRYAVRVLASSCEESPARIAPSKGSFPRTVDPASVPWTFGRPYDTDAFWPADLASVGEPYVLRDHRGVVVRAHPFQYNPVTGVLRTCRRLTLEVARTGPGGENVVGRRSVPRPRARAFEDLYRDHFLNAEQRATPYAPLEEEGDLLVIAYDPFIPDLSSLVAHKTALGIPTTVVGISTIGNNPMLIKSYIQGVYDASNLAYVLLVGDAAQVATPIRPVGGEQGAADPLYAKLAGSDDYPDVLVGRFSASTAAQLATQVRRTIEYEEAAPYAQPWFKRGVGIASAEGAGAGDEGQSDREHIGQIRDWLLADGHALVDEIYDPGATDVAVATAVDAGRRIINYCGHGWAMGWGTTGFDNADVDALVNDGTLPVVVSVACNNGEFHHYDACFAEAWLRAVDETTGAPAGAAAMYASSVSQSWAPPMEGQDEFNLRLTDRSRPYRTFGALCFAGSSSMMDAYGGAGVEMFDTWIVFGDPSLRVGPPRTLDVTPKEGLAASGPAGGPYDVASVAYTLTNNADAPLDFAATPLVPWVDTDPASGTIAPLGTATVAVVLNDASRNLDNGAWGGAVQFANLTDHVGDTQRPVSLRIGAGTVATRWALGSDPGWERQGEWEFGTPTGAGGGKGLNPDPTSGATGSTVFGANLAGNVSKTIGGPYYLTSAAADLSSCSDVTLGFKRWLNTYGPPDMTETVEVSRDGVTWTSVWTSGATVADPSWTDVALDVSALADGATALRVRWSYQVVGHLGTAGSGWNLDDVELRGCTPTATTTLVVEKEALSWAPVPAAIGYDVVRGDLRTLRDTAGDFTDAVTGCVAAGVTATSAPESSNPAPGEGTWYLVRARGYAGPMTWQTLAGPQVGLRDAEIGASPATCP